ncbi:MAG: RDD family protein [Acidimicrobiales bacterium]
MDPTAVLGRRIGAYIVDGLIGLGLAALAFLLVAEHPSGQTSLSPRVSEKVVESFDADRDIEAVWRVDEAFAGVHRDEDIWFVEGADFWVVTAVGFAFFGGALALLQGLTGRTPGKALFGLATVTEDGQPPGVGKALLRWVLLLVDGFFIVPGLLTAALSKGHRRIGDIAAGTLVVEAVAAGRPILVPGLTAPPTSGGAPEADAEWDAARRAWIRWDSSVHEWMQWDDDARSWRPITR